MGRRLISAAVAFAMVILGVPFGASPASAASPDIVISQVYGGGGNSGATLKNDFIELFNRGTSPVSLTGWSVQYASATGSTWQKTDLTGSIAPGQHYLVQEAAGAGGTVSLPTPDASGGIAMSASAGKVALVTTTTLLTCGSSVGNCFPNANIRDFVGYGSANNYEDGAPAPGLTNTTAVFRAVNGCTDTDNNSGDFATGAPAPRNTASPFTPCPTGDTAPSVVFRQPSPGQTGVARDSNVTIGFSEAVTLTGTWFDITCAGSGNHPASVGSGGTNVYVLDPATNFANNETCTVTVYAGQVTDLDTADPPDNMATNDVFTFQTADTFTCGDPATKIHQVQGSGLSTPMNGATVAIEGVVVGDYQAAGGFGGYYVQEEPADADADPATSEGIFVQSAASFRDVSPGDVVRVRGRAGESFSLTQISSVTDVLICATGAGVPATSVSLPVASVADLEAFEGMLVTFGQTLTVTEVFNLGRFGEVSLSGVGRLFTPTAVAAPGAPALAVSAANARSRIILDDGNSLQNIDPTRYPQGGLSASNTLRVGDTLPGLTGVMDYRFSNYRIQPVGALEFAHTNPRTAAPAAVGGNVKIASFNVLNFFNGDGLGGGFPTPRGAETQFELDRQLAKEVSALRAIDADIVGLMEIENDSGPNSALADLVRALNDAMGAGTYAYIDTGAIGSDAIKVALIYKPASMTPVGAFQTLDSADDPRFIDTLNRPALAQTFEHRTTSQRLTVVVNHLKSKGSVCTGDPDIGDGQGNCNRTRTAAAAALADWIASDPTGSGDPDALIIGDLNAYTFEDPITTLTGAGFENLIRRYGGLDAYSYVFNGESGYLDHALATSSLAAQVTGATDWHINPDEPTVFDYNTNFKSANQVNSFYANGPYRSSDHDPVIVGLRLVDVTPPTITGATTTSPNANGWWNTPVTVHFTCTDNSGSVSCPDDVTVTTDGAAQSVTGTATDGSGNSATATVGGINIDTVTPTITFSGATTYTVADTVNIGCAATDTLSDIDTQTCPTASGPAYSFGLGTHTLTATATDRAGNTTTASTTFTVTADAASACALARSFVANTGIANSLCAKLDAAAAAQARGNANAHDGQLRAFVNEVEAQRGKALTGMQADVLIALAGAL